MGQIDNVRTAFATYPESQVLNNYKKIAMNMLHLNFPLLSETELAAAIDYSISSNYRDSEIIVDNNYKKITIDNMTLRSLSDYIISREPIITSYGVMFNKHGTVPNPIYNMLDKFLKNRKILKKEMFKYPKGSEDFEKYDLLQLLAKLDANAFYGAIGMYSCIFYNIYVASSITTQGRSYNAAAALFFESFLNNNVPMGSMNEVVEFIYNVINEKHYYKNEDIIEKHASIDETFFQLLSSTGFGWVPSNEEMGIIWEILSSLDQDKLDRLFYKNNLFNFIDNASVKQGLLYILQTLKSPFMDPNNPPEEIKELLKEFCEVLKEFVYYDKQIIDRLDKMANLIRSVSIIQDTDSAIISFDGWYRYVRNMCIDIPMSIKNMEFDALEFIENGNIVEKQPIGKIEEYSFINDDMIEVDRLIDPMVIIPQDGLRYSIINILVYCTNILANDYMNKYCINSHSNNSRPCLISLKNEFLFKRVMIKKGVKKNYASKVELQEGNITPEHKSLQVKGIEIFTKSTVNPTVQSKLRKILYDDILNSETIDQVAILKDIATVEKEIYNSIINGEKKFFKPVKIKAMSSYENPMRIQGISASNAYNELHEPNTEAIDLSIRNSVDVIKVDINKKNIDKIKDSFPGVHERGIKLLETKAYANGISSIAIPRNENVPDWVLPFIEYAEIINNNIKGFPIESIGLNRGAGTNNTTNIINF